MKIYERVYDNPKTCEHGYKAYCPDCHCDYNCKFPCKWCEKKGLQKIEYCECKRCEKCGKIIN